MLTRLVSRFKPLPAQHPVTQAKGRISTKNPYFHYEAQSDRIGGQEALAFPLMELPAEIHSVITEHLKPQNIRDLIVLCSTNKHWKRIVSQDLPAHVTIRRANDIQAALTAYPTARSINIRRCSDFTDEYIKQIAKLSQLQNLDLKDTRITNAGLAHLSGLAQLQSLNLANKENFCLVK